MITQHGKDNESVYSAKTDKTDMTTKTVMTSLTVEMEKLGNLVSNTE